MTPDVKMLALRMGIYTGIPMLLTTLAAMGFGQGITFDPDTGKLLIEISTEALLTGLAAGGGLNGVIVALFGKK